MAEASLCFYDQDQGIVSPPVPIHGNIVELQDRRTVPGRPAKGSSVISRALRYAQLRVMRADGWLGQGQRAVAVSLMIERGIADGAGEEGEAGSRQVLNLERPKRRALLARAHQHS